MTHIKVTSDKVLDLIDEGLSSLSESAELDSVWREGEDDIDRTVRAQIRRELQTFLKQLEEFIIFSGSREVELSLEDYNKLVKARKAWR